MAETASVCRHWLKRVLQLAIPKTLSRLVFPSQSLSNSGRSCGKIGTTDPVEVLCLNVIIRPALRSTSLRRSERASACPSPASPRNSRKSALSFASGLNTCARTSAMIALNCSQVGVSRIGFSRLIYFRCAAGEPEIILSPKRHCEDFF
jgi:hypothetical protein